MQSFKQEQQRRDRKDVDFLQMDDNASISTRAKQNIEFKTDEIISLQHDYNTFHYLMNMFEIKYVTMLGLLSRNQIKLIEIEKLGKKLLDIRRRIESLFFENS